MRMQFYDDQEADKVATQFLNGRLQEITVFP